MARKLRFDRKQFEGRETSALRTEVRQLEEQFRLWKSTRFGRTVEDAHRRVGELQETARKQLETETDSMIVAMAEGRPIPLSPSLPTSWLIATSDDFAASLHRTIDDNLAVFAVETVDEYKAERDRRQDEIRALHAEIDIRAAEDAKAVADRRVEVAIRRMTDSDGRETDYQLIA